MSRRVLALIVILMVTALLVSGCLSEWVQSWRGSTDEDLLPPPPEQVQDMPHRESGGVWMEVLGAEPGSLDPAYVVTLDEGRVASTIYSGLVRHSTGGTILPDLAETWEVHRNGLQFTFHLRRDVTFSNGRHFTAEDVLFSFMRLLSPQTQSPRAWVLEDILGARQYMAGDSNQVAGLAAEDEYTVMVTLEEPRADFLHRLTMPAAFILNRETVETYKTMTNSAGGVPGFFPVGTGPFHIEDHREGEYLQLARNHAYHGPGPYLDALRFILGVDAATARTMFADGQLSTVRVSPSEADDMSIDVLQSVQPAVYYLGLNNQDGPTDDLRVRQALNMAVDREQVLESIIPGGHVLANGSIPPSVAGHNPDLEGFPHDPDRAQELLSEAGHSGGLDMELVRGSSSQVVDITDALVKQLAESSIHVDPITAGAGELFALLSDGDDIDSFYLSWWADYPDPGNFLFPLFHSSNWGDAGNRVRFSDQQVDTLLEACAATVQDDEKRHQMYSEIEELIFSQAPWIPLYFPVTFRAVQPFVREYPSEGVYTSRRLDTVWFDKLD